MAREWTLGRLAACAGVWSACLMEPLTALLVIAASYGASALVQALGGGPQLSSLTGELVKALADTESKIDERLAGIELELDELLDQQYQVALSSGLRYMLDAIPAAASDKAHDLSSARDRFIEAQSAARSTLQQAIAERYLLLCLPGLQRIEGAKDALTRLEGLAMTAAFEAMILTEFNQEKATVLMRREGSSGRHLPLGERDRVRQAKLRVKTAALDRICMCGRLLGEAAMFASALSLPMRASPPAEAINDSSLIEEPYNSRGGSVTIPPLCRFKTNHMVSDLGS